jgi:K+-sensing histidine kinase KdpD
MRMSVLKGAVSVAVTLAVVSAVTAILLYFKLATLGLEHPIFFYLLPIGLVMMLYGSMPALLAVFTAAICTDYFLYDPIYSFDIPSRGELSDLACFALLGLMGVKCANELFRPSEKLPAAKSRYGRP